MLLACGGALADTGELSMTFAKLDGITIADIANDGVARGSVYAAIVLNITAALGNEEMNGFPYENLFLGIDFIGWNEDLEIVMLSSYEESSDKMIVVMYALSSETATLGYDREAGTRGWTADSFRKNIKTLIGVGNDELITDICELTEEEKLSGIQEFKTALGIE